MREKGILNGQERNKEPRKSGWQHDRTDKIDRAGKTVVNGTDC